MGEVPVGAVLVCGDRLICQAHNLVEQTNDPTAHAEMICIREASRLLGARMIGSSSPCAVITRSPCSSQGRGCMLGHGDNLLVP